MNQRNFHEPGMKLCVQQLQLLCLSSKNSCNEILETLQTLLSASIPPLPQQEQIKGQSVPSD